MDVKQIAVENFRCHKRLEIPLSKVTILVGPNGSGKSSIVEAPATMLLGQNTWTARTGIKLKNLIRKGESKGKVTLVGKKEISRVLTKSGSKVVLDEKKSLTQHELLTNLKVSEAQLRAALIPQSFLSLSLKEQKDVLFDLLGEDMTLEDVEKRIPASKTWEKLASRWREDHPDEIAVDLDALYKFVYDARRKYRKKHEDPASEETDEHTELMEQLENLSKNISGAEFENERNSSAKEKKARLPLLKKRLKKAKDTKASYDELQEKRKKIDGLIRKAEKEESAVEAVLGEAKRQVNRFKGVKTKEGKVHCSIGLECPHGEDTLKEKQSYSKGQTIASEGKLKSIKVRIKEHDEELQSVSLDLQACGNVDRDIDKLRSEIDHIGTMDDPGEEVDTEELEAKKAKVKKKLENLASAAPRKKDDQTESDLDHLVSGLDVNGIKAQIVEEKISALEKEINKALSQFGPWGIQFFVDSSFEPTILSNEGNRQLGELSDGERNLISLILQDVFSQRSNVNLVTLDNLDLLDKEARVRFFEVAAKLKSKVLVAMAQHAGVESSELIKIHALGKAPAPAAKQEEGSEPIEDLL